MTQSSYRPEIDALRAVAVIPVVLFHMEVDWVPGGFLGVDVFFVISGFLITQILMREASEGTASYRHFLARRMRRIFPVLIAVVASTLAMAYGFLSWDERDFATNQSLASLLSLANFYYWSVAGDYWAPAAEGSVLLHTWSLSVEEQFYLFFPWIVWGSMRFGRRALMTSLIVIFLFSLAVFVVGMDAFPEATFYLLPTRAWELSAGALLAAFADRRERLRFFFDWMPTSRQRIRLVRCERRLNHLAARGHGAWCGLALIMAAFVFPGTARGIGLNAMLAVLGTMLLIAAPGGSTVHRWLTLQPLVYIGKISYSLYMWHWPLIFFWKRLTGELDVVMTLVACFVAAVISYHGIEQTTRRREGVVPWILGAWLFLLAATAAIVAFDRKVEVDISQFPRPIWYGYHYSLWPKEGQSDWMKRVVGDAIVPEREAPLDAYRTGGILSGPGDTPQLVLVGDSHATMWANTIQQIAQRLSLRSSIWAINGIDPYFDPQATDDIKIAYDQTRRELIASWRPKIVLIATRYTQSKMPDFEAFVEFMSRHADHVLLIEQVPELPIGDQSVTRYLSSMGIAPIPGKRQYHNRVRSPRIDESRQRALEIIGRFDNAHFVPLFDLYAFGEDKAWILDGDRTLFLDDDHLTEFGAMQGAPWIEAAIGELLGL